LRFREKTKARVGDALATKSLRGLSSGRLAPCQRDDILRGDGKLKAVARRWLAYLLLFLRFISMR
jgi:hypothetical protein